MRETIRDFLIAVGAAAALFAAVASYLNGRDIAAVREDLTAQIAAVREDLATVQGTLTTTSDTVIAHVNASGLHGSTMTTVAR